MLQAFRRQNEKSIDGYTDRTIGIWHIAVDNKSARKKCNLDYPKIKPHFIEATRLDIGAIEGEIDGIKVMIYDRERVVCAGRVFA